MGLGAIWNGTKAAAVHVGTFTADIGIGFAKESKAVVDDVGVGIGMIKRSRSGDEAVRAAQQAQNAAAWAYVKAHPVHVVKQSILSVAEPVKADWVAGRPGSAIGRSGVLALNLVLPGIGTEKVVRIAQAAADSAASQAVEGAEIIAKTVT